MFGVNGGEFLVLLVVVALVVGPRRLPGYAEQLGAWVRGLRALVRDARRRVDEELEDAGVDWEALDLRRYDPRRIVREALLDGSTDTMPPVGKATTSSSSGPDAGEAAADVPPPCDDEAT